MANETLSLTYSNLKSKSPSMSISPSSAILSGVTDIDQVVHSLSLFNSVIKLQNM